MICGIDASGDALISLKTFKAMMMEMEPCFVPKNLRI